MLVAVAGVVVVTFVNYALFKFQILMSVLITMGHVPIFVPILKVVTIVRALPGMTFNLIITIVQVNILLYVLFSDVQYYLYIDYRNIASNLSIS